jgi:hypothetical protein
MANNNFVVQNGLTAGAATIFAGNGDVVSGGNITVGGAGSSVSKLVVTNFSTANAVITGGSLTGVPVSGSTGSFTTLAASGVTSFNGNLVAGSGVASTDTTHGALVVVGGVGVGGNLNVANAVVATGGLYSKTNYTGSYTDGIVVDYVDGTGRISVGGADGISFYNGGPAGSLLFSIDQTGAQSATGSISAPSLRAATIGNTGAVFTGSSITTTGATHTTTVSTNFSSGNAVITGGSIAGSPISGSTGSFTTLAASGATALGSTLSVTGTTTAAAITASGQVSVTNATQSTSVSTGALTVAGGVGIGGNLYIGGNLILAGNITSTNTTINNEQAGNLIVGTPLTFVATNANIQYGGNQNSFLQLAMQNASGGNNASTDFVATANNGTNDDTFIDMGINSSGYSNATYAITYPNDGYLFVQGNTTTNGGNLVLATMTNKDIVFATGGQALNNEVMRITSGNVVAIKSTVSSTSTTTGAFKVAGGAGIAGALYAGTIFDAGNRVVTSVTPTAGTGISLGSVVSTGPATSWIITNTGVVSLTASTGLSVSSTTGAITITNTGVTSAAAGTGISLSASSGAVTFTNSGVTAIAGTTNQIAASASTGSVTLSLPSTVAINTLNAATIGNISANHVGTGTYLTSLSGGSITAASVPNSALTNSSVTVTAGTGLSGGGAVSLGGTVTITNAGVTAVTGTSGQITASASTGSVALSLPSTLNLSIVNAATLGNVGANVVGTGTYLTGLNASNLSSGTVPSAQISGAYTGITQVGTLTAGAIGTGFTAIPNSALANSSVTVTAGTGLSGGGAVSLGGTVTITNAGVTSAVAGTGISVSGATGAVTVTNTGVTSAVAGTDISVSGATGAVTISDTSTLATVTGRGATTSTAVTLNGGVTSTTGTFSSNIKTTGGGIYGGTQGYAKFATTAGDILLDNGTTDTPGVHFYYGNNTNFGIDVASSLLRFTTNLDETGGAVQASLSTTGTFTATLFAGKATSAQYADLAENYLGDAAYEPGTVVMFGGENEVTLADIETTAVAGVVSTNPAHLMNGGLEGETVVALALQGRVPCKVFGPVRKGDMMISAGNGYAKAAKNPSMGQVIGKALENLAEGKGVIEIVVGRL